ncbi:MAG: hypothetical protein IPL39_22960 [Opitutaceae bacterium]|nr:hypothetical protein [Opitutaceae bacterium]
MRSLILAIGLFSCLSAVAGPIEVKQAAEQLSAVCDPASFTKERQPSSRIDESSLRTLLAQMDESVTFLDTTLRHAQNSQDIPTTVEADRLRSLECLVSINRQVSDIVHLFSILNTGRDPLFGVPESILGAARKMNAATQAYRSKLITDGFPDSHESNKPHQGKPEGALPITSSPESKSP